MVMSVGAARSSAATPAVSDLLTRARAIAALARERAQQTEADRRVGDDMIERMRQADLFRIMQPRSHGGFEYGFDVFAQVVAAIAGGCGSTGWVYGLLASHQWLIACFPTAAQDEVWQDRTALAAGTPGFFLLRSADCVIDDNWHTMGLAGTGSKNIVARDVFVPAHRTLAFAELTDATAPGMRANPNPLYRQSFLAVLPITIVSPVLGMAEGALADFLAMAGVRTTRGAVAGGNRRMAELTTVQMRVAEASACIDAARLLMFRDLAQAFETAARGDPIGVDVRLRNRRDQAFCVRLLVGAIDALFLATGGQGLFLEQPLQRAWRDAHAAASHISLNWDSTGSIHARLGAQGAILSRIECLGSLW